MSTSGHTYFYPHRFAESVCFVLMHNRNYTIKHMDVIHYNEYGRGLLFSYYLR